MEEYGFQLYSNMGVLMDGDIALGLSEWFVGGHKDKYQHGFVVSRIGRRSLEALHMLSSIVF